MKSDGLTRIWLGETVFAKNKQLELLEMDGDGFVIRFFQNQNMVILGPTDWGTEFGIYDFLERYLGIRWVLPGPCGDHVPLHHHITIKEKDIQEEPAFFSRQLSGLQGQAQEAWARRNRLHGRIQFHHNLDKLFPIDRYRVAHPEFFPTVDGKPYYPPAERPWDWQPCFSAPGIVEEAARNISAYFASRPTETSYSLGINDSSMFCESDKPHISEGYFRWANAVVEVVLKEHPEKWFGCLAYRGIANPPSSETVHQRIVPFRTSDRMKWADPEARNHDEQNTLEWGRTAKLLGWYDYLYGSPYLLPRVYFHLMADYLRFGTKHGVKAMYGEAYPNWGEGPKLYVALKLLWNPWLDVDNLLQDWYESAVGKEAAPYLAAYYAHWEKFWTHRVAKTEWFKVPGFVRFYHPGYLDTVEYEEITLSRRLLETALHKAETSDQRARARTLLRAFEYYEASVISYLGLVKKKAWAGKTEDFFEKMNERRLALVDEFQNDPVLVHPTRFDSPPYKGLRWGQMAVTKPVNEPQQLKQQ